jgi:hypothetical protein
MKDILKQHPVISTFEVQCREMDALQHVKCGICSMGRNSQD